MKNKSYLGKDKIFNAENKRLIDVFGWAKFFLNKYCDGVVLQIYLHHKFQWPQE